jgi:polyisoprenyl-phosphate glycosyltransferase
MRSKPLLSIVVPVFNEEKGLGLLFEKLRAAVAGLSCDIEFIFVNDGSRDGSLYLLGELHQMDPRVKVIDLSRNFGHQNALCAGIDHAGGDAVVLMDADMEDDPGAIPLFVNSWQQGNLVVYARRGERSVPWFRGIFFRLFHWANKMMSSIPVEASGTFCLMDRKVVDHLKALKERNRYIPGLRSWVGFKQAGIDLVRGPRYDKCSRVKFGGLFKLALDSFTAFSTAPLQVSMMLGIVFSLASFVGIGIVVFMKVVVKTAIVGWASTICVILLAAGVQLICLWLQGEYLSRIFTEVKDRPNYIINNKIGF